MRTIVIGCVLGLLIPAASDAAAPARVTFKGCPERGVEKGCMMVQSGGETYDITAAKPPIKFKGLGVSGSGVISGDPNICMQGKRLKDIKYTYTRMKCPVSEAAKADKPPAKK